MQLFKNAVAILSASWLHAQKVGAMSSSPRRLLRPLRRSVCSDCLSLKSFNGTASAIVIMSTGEGGGDDSSDDDDDIRRFIFSPAISLQSVHLAESSRLFYGGWLLPTYGRSIGFDPASRHKLQHQGERIRHLHAHILTAPFPLHLTC